MMTLRRYARAFWLAVRLTASGQQPPALQHPELLEWVRQMAGLVEAVYTAAEAHRLDAARRKTISLRLDGRLMTFDTVLAALRYHARQEYPSLLRSGLSHTYLAIQSSNMNDRYWLARLREAPELSDPPLRAALDRLLAHLEAIPAQKSTKN